MIIVKLYKGTVMKIVEAEEVNIYPVGPWTGTAPEPKDRDNTVREVATILGQRSDAFFITDSHKERPQGWADEVQFFDVAYIENSSGATTEIVRPY